MRSNNKSVSKPQRDSATDVVVLFADIIDSSKIAWGANHGDYNSMIREYHTIAAKVIDGYLANRNISSGLVFRRTYGDEILLVFKRNEIDVVETHAVRLGLLLEKNWYESQYNVERRNERREPLYLRIGIGCGVVTFTESVWSQGFTPEGAVLTKVKRIESNASDPSNNIEFPEHFSVDQLNNRLSQKIGEVRRLSVSIENELGTLLKYLSDIKLGSMTTIPESINL